MDLFTMPFAGMLFVLLALLIMGGLQLLKPLAAHLGALLEQRVSEGRADPLVSGEEVAELRRAVEELQSEFIRLSEQQQFTERLLEERSPAADWVGEQG